MIENTGFEPLSDALSFIFGVCQRAGSRSFLLFVYMVYSILPKNCFLFGSSAQKLGHAIDISMKIFPKF